MDNINRLLSANELAEALGVSLSTVRRLTRDGQIPVIRVRSMVRYDISAVVEALGRWAQSPVALSSEDEPHAR